MARTKILYENASMLIRWPLENEADSSAITSGVTVEAHLFEPGTTTDITDGSDPINPISLSHQSGKTWQGTIPSNADLSAGDQVDIRYTVDGGNDLSDEQWDRNVPVRERGA